MSEPQSLLIWWSNEGDFFQYMYSDIFKFNLRNNISIGFHTNAILEGKLLSDFNDIIKEKLIELINDYHIDSTVNFGRSCVIKKVLGKELKLNLFSSEVDELIDNINNVYEMFNSIYLKNGKILTIGEGLVDENWTPKLV